MRNTGEASATKDKCVGATDSLTDARMRAAQPPCRCSLPLGRPLGMENAPCSTNAEPRNDSLTKRALSSGRVLPTSRSSRTSSQSEKRPQGHLLPLGCIIDPSLLRCRVHAQFAHAIHRMCVHVRQRRSQLSYNLCPHRASKPKKTTRAHSHACGRRAKSRKGRALKWLTRDGCPFRGAPPAKHRIHHKQALCAASSARWSARHRSTRRPRSSSPASAASSPRGRPEATPSGASAPAWRKCEEDASNAETRPRRRRPWRWVCLGSHQV